jgi:hypothetical protein
VRCTVAFLPPQRAGGPAAVQSAVRKADESNAIGCPTFGFRDHPRPSRVNPPPNALSQHREHP